MRYNRIDLHPIFPSSLRNKTRFHKYYSPAFIAPTVVFKYVSNYVACKLVRTQERGKMQGELDKSAYQ